MTKGYDKSLNLLTFDSREAMNQNDIEQVTDIVVRLFIRQFFKENESGSINIDEKKKRERTNVHLANQ